MTTHEAPQRSVAINAEFKWPGIVAGQRAVQGRPLSRVQWERGGERTRGIGNTQLQAVTMFGLLARFELSLRCSNALSLAGRRSNFG